ncbi:FAD-dependent oxidoreductase [Pyrolobus fumarii]|nr:FAD-dependent oxidoreductase [Pyrolobus fumarii]
MRVVVVGGGAAGMATASRVRRLRRDWEVVVLEKSRWVSFALCGTPYYVGCVVRRIGDLVHYPLEEFTKRRGIDVRIGHEVVEVGDGYVRVRGGDGREYRLEYDKLVIATGAYPVKPRGIEGIDSEGVFVIGHLDDAIAIREWLDRNTREGDGAVVVGGGLVGVEMAEAFRSWGLRVTIVEKLGWLLPGILDPDMGERLTKIIAGVEGVNVVTGKGVSAVKRESGRAAGVLLEDGSEVGGRVVLVAVGRRPNTALAEQLGARIGETGAVWVNERMETSVEGVYAVGDVAETVSIVTGRRTWLPFAQVANKMGYVAGSNIAGLDARFAGAAGTVAARVFGVTIAKTGLTLEEARKLGFDAGSVTVEAGTKPRYMPGGSWVTLKLVYDRSSGRLLGAQALSGDESGFWRINVVAALLHKHADVWDLFTVDVGYAPPLNPVWDPLIVAARLALRDLGGKR